MALRHTVSPQLSNRASPPVTRSVSRNGFRQANEPATSTPISRRSIQPGMHIETIERVYESADDTDLNCSKFIYEQHFTLNERTSMKKEMWYDWLEYRFRMFRCRFFPSAESICKSILVVIFIAMFVKYAKDCCGSWLGIEDGPHIFHQTNTMDDTWKEEMRKIQESFSNLRNEFSSQFSNLQKNLNNLDSQQDNLMFRIEKLEKELRENSGWKESMVTEIKEINLWKTEMMETIDFLRRDIEEKKATKIIETYEKPSVQPIDAYAPNYQLQPIRPTHRFPLSVNVANSLIGASIDFSCSSRSVSAKDGIFYDIMSYFGTFQEGYVLLDRELLTPGEAWCTYDKKATLTVKLARYVTPTAVSYQHVRWNRIVPYHAPKLYDLVACLDNCCQKSEPLVTNCEYKASEDGNDEQEQFCSIPTIPNLPPINHVQFRFHENHGGVTKTCAYLVRVFGEPAAPPKEQVTDNGTASLYESTIVNSVTESDIA